MQQPNICSTCQNGQYRCVQAQSLSAGQRSFLFDYLCEHVPQTDEEEARTFVRRLPILPTFIEARRRPAQDALLCSQQLLSTFVGDISLLPEALLVRSTCNGTPYTVAHDCFSRC